MEERHGLPTFSIAKGAMKMISVKDACGLQIFCSIGSNENGSQLSWISFKDLGLPFELIKCVCRDGHIK